MGSSFYSLSVLIERGMAGYRQSGTWSTTQMWSDGYTAKENMAICLWQRMEPTNTFTINSFYTSKLYDIGT